MGEHGLRRYTSHAAARAAAVLLLVLLLAAFAGAAGPGVSAAGAAKGTQQESAAELVKAVESRLSRLATYSASFTQAYRSAAIGQAVVESGRIFVKRPGRMRWDYRDPDKKVFLVRPDGTTLTYVPADRTAVRGALPTDAPHLRLLLGDSDLLATFDVEDVELKSAIFPGTRHLKLTPRAALPGVELAYLEVDAAARQVVRVLVLDALGNEVDLVLSRVKENTDLKESAFVVDLPRGVEIRDAAGAGTR